jgi:hypothetical protein
MMGVLGAITEGASAFIAFTVMVIAIAVTLFLTVSR